MLCRWLVAWCSLLDEAVVCSRSSCSLKEALRSERSRWDSRGDIGRGGCILEVKDFQVRAAAAAAAVFILRGRPLLLTRYGG